MFRLLPCLFALLFVTACAKTVPPVQVAPTQPQSEEVPFPRRELPPEVMFDVPQLVTRAVSVSDAPLMSASEQMILHAKALERFFAPWRMARTSLDAGEAFWGVKTFARKQGYSENLQPYPVERWNRLVALQNMPGYPAMAVPGIITRNTSVRVLPTLRPFFLDPKQPGEGFPFDYFQNSALWLGSPVLISHVSTDRAWYLVETAYTYGWVRVEDVALVGKAFRNQYESRRMAALLHDDLPLIDGVGRLLGQTHIGALFPVQAQTGQGLTVKVPVRGASGQAEIQTAQLSSLQAASTPLPLTSRAIATLADAMAGQQYGWGGLFENRDCSSTMRDLFLPFGVFLPRNSALQAKGAGSFIPLDKLRPDAKLDAIRAQGVPFLSFIWLQGHIGLYLGVDQRGEPLMLHNIWGVRTMLPSGGEGRAVVGRLTISTLRPGEYRADVRADSFLARVRGLAVVSLPR